MKRERAAVAAMVVATLLWGATFVVIRDALHAIDPFTMVFVRFATAGALLAIVLLARRRALDRRAIVGGICAGLFAAGGYLFQAMGLTSTSAGTSAFLTCTGTLLAGIFAWPLLGQRPGALLVFGLTLAALGSALLPARNDWRLGAGEAWTLLGAVAFALQVVVIARFAARADVLAMTAFQALTVAVVLAPFGGAARRELSILGPAGWWRLAYLVIAGSLLAPLAQIGAQRTLQPGRIGLLFALEPVFALAFAVTIGGESFAPRWWAGAALILLAVVTVEGRAARRASSSHPASG